MERAVKTVTGELDLQLCSVGRIPRFLDGVELLVSNLNVGQLIPCNIFHLIQMSFDQDTHRIPHRMSMTVAAAVWAMNLTWSSSFSLFPVVRQMYLQIVCNDLSCSDICDPVRAGVWRTR